MQTVTLSEFCRIVKKVSKENKGKLSLVYIEKKEPHLCSFIWFEYGVGGWYTVVES